MFRNRIQIVFLLFVFAVFSFSVCAAEATKNKDMERINKALSVQKEAAAKAEAKERQTSRDLADLRSKLVQATQELQKKQQEQTGLEERLDELVAESDRRSGSLQKSRERLAHMTSALLQLGRKPPGLLLLHEDSADNHVHRTILLRSILPRLRMETTRIMTEIDTYQELQDQTSHQRRMVAAARQNLQWQRHNLDQLVKVRQGLLKKTKEEKEAIARQLDRLTSEAKDLKQLMERVSRPAWQETVVGKEKAVEIKNLRPGLKMPVAGKMVRGFGDKDEFGVVSEGLLIKGPFGAPVVAPQAGRVVFKGPFRGYGNIVILQHPNGYHSFLSGFSRIDAEMGQQVDAGEPLGILPLKNEGDPRIYFEWRKGTDPVDPVKTS